MDANGQKSTLVGGAHKEAGHPHHQIN